MTEIKNVFQKTPFIFQLFYRVTFLSVFQKTLLNFAMRITKLKSVSWETLFNFVLRITFLKSVFQKTLFSFVMRVTFLKSVFWKTLFKNVKRLKNWKVFSRKHFLFSKKTPFFPKKHLLYLQCNTPFLNRQLRCAPKIAEAQNSRNPK